MVEKEQVMKCCVHFWRLLFIILNSIFLVIGLALVGLAIYLLASQNDLKFLTGSEIGSGAVLILIAGLITAAIAFVGVLGAIGMWPILLIVYIVLLFIIVVLEIVAGVLGFVYQNDLVTVSAERAGEAISMYRDEESDELREDVNFVVDFLQNEFECCGYFTSSEWIGTAFFNSSMRYPDSCNCTELTEQPEDMMENRCVVQERQSIYIRACNETFSDFLNSNLIIVGGVGIAFGVFEILGIAVAIALTCCFCYIKKHDDEFDFTKAV